MTLKLKQPGRNRNKISINGIVVGILIILFMTNLNALADHFIHPEIPYFDEEHLVVGGLTFVVTLILFILLYKYFNDLIQTKKSQAILIEKLQIEKEKIKENESKLLQINTTKAKLFSIIAHDLKSPFNSILGFSGLLIKNIEKYDIKKNTEFAMQINSSALFAFNLLNNLLIWAKSQTGEIGFSPEKINLLDVANNTINGLNASAKMKYISINNNIQEKIVVMADPNMLMTILRNLISNAIKFTNHDGEIIIDANHVDNMIEINVTDNGIGMDNDQMNGLFADGIHKSTNGTASETGSGLGLILCKEFVEKHNGEIWVTSELNKGSKFTFTLPIP